jgi:hypothetical protein
VYIHLRCVTKDSGSAKTQERLWLEGTEMPVQGFRLDLWEGGI